MEQITFAICFLIEDEVLLVG